MSARPRPILAMPLLLAATFAAPAAAEVVAVPTGGDPYVFTLGVSGDGRYVVHRSSDPAVSDFDQGRFAVLTDLRNGTRRDIGAGFPGVRWTDVDNVHIRFNESNDQRPTRVLFEAGRTLTDTGGECVTAPVDPSCTLYDLIRVDIGPGSEELRGFWPKEPDAWPWYLNRCDAFSVAADGETFAMLCGGVNEDWMGFLGRDDVLLWRGGEVVHVTYKTREGDGIQADEASGEPAISADGRFVAFPSAATNLVTGDTNGLADAFLYDADSDSFELLSTAIGGGPSDGAVGGVDVSADGRFVVFSSTATDLHPDDTDADVDIFLRDRTAGTTTLVSTMPARCADSPTGADEPRISADGAIVAFLASCGGLHLFGWDRFAKTVQQVDVTPTGGTDSGEVFSFELTDGGDKVLFASTARDLATLPSTPILSWAYVAPTLPDEDGDGLLDHWEDNGIDIDGDGTIELNLPALGANRRHKDLFVEMDHLVATGHDHRFSANAQANVIAAFAAAPVTNPDGNNGITLHFDTASDEAIPEAGNEDLSGVAAVPGFRATWWGTAGQRGAANATHLREARSLVYRYVLFGHDYGGGGLSGEAEVSGDELLVSLGAGANSVGSTGQQDSTFMHEYGHTLGLRHGGVDHINCKPNYLSVMSYSYQFPVFGVRRTLDYSRAGLADLNETALSEPAGIGGPATWDAVWGPVPLGSAPANGALNWNGDTDSTDTGVAQDINQQPGCNGWNPEPTLYGANDWSAIIYNHRGTRGYASGMAQTVEELTWDDHLERALASADPDASHPVADPGEDVTIEEGEEFSLDGSASWDDEGDVLDHHWEQVGGPDLQLEEDGERARIVGPNVDEDTDVQVELAVFDGYLWSVPEIVTITILDVGDGPSGDDDDDDVDPADCGCDQATGDGAAGLLLLLPTLGIVRRRRR